MHRKKLDQKELAKRLGVSQMTISRVLNSQTGVSKKLREKILKFVEQCDYVHDQVAAGLRAKSTQVFGLVIPDVSYSFFPNITKNIECLASKEGYNVILAHSYESYIEECKQINLLLGFRVSGLIIAPAGKQNEIDIYQKLQRLKIPFVFVDRIKKNIDCSSVVTDIEKGAAEMANYLIQKGYKKWGYLAGPSGVSSSDEHLRGLKKSLTAAGLDESSMVMVRAGFDQEHGYKAVQKLLSQVNPDVIVAVNDPVAIGAYRFLKEKGIKVPGDMGLVGFSDLESSDILEVPLTTVRERTNVIGQKAISLLLNEKSSSVATRQKLRIAGELIIRNSA